MEHPTLGNGKICYIEIPCDDAAKSSQFFKDVFGWNIRDNHGSISFDDGVGEVSGMWVEGPSPANNMGFVISIMVDDIVASSELVELHGGKIIKAFDPDSKEATAHFSDPFGNIWGLFQERG